MERTKEITMIGIITILIALFLPIALGLISNIENSILSSEILTNHYFGTYSFTNENDGDSGTDIDFITIISHQDLNTEARIINNLDNHNKVLEIYDNNNNGYIDVRNSFSSQLYGSMEFWGYFNDTWQTSYMTLYDDTSTAVGIEVWENDWYYETFGPPGYATIPNVNDPQNNTWIHIRIDFETSTNNYLGMPQYRFIVRIDDVSSGVLSMPGPQSYINRFGFSTISADSDYSSYYDAIGYDWNSYDLGDNREFEVSIVYLSDVADPTVITFLTVLLPLFAVIGLTISYLPKTKK